MANVKKKKETSNRGLRIVLYAFTLFFAGIVFALDSNVPLGTAVGALYAIVVLFTWLLQGKYDTLIITLICTVLFILGYIESPPAMADNYSPEINRIISLVIIWVCAVLVILAKKGFDGLDKALENLEDKVEERTKRLKESQEELRESEQLYRYLYEHANEMYVSIDPNDATIITCNQTLCRVTGYSQEEIIGQDMYFIYHPDCHDEAKKSFHSFEETKKLGGVAKSLRTKKGKKIEVLLNVSAATDDEGNIQYYRSSWTDVTDFNKAQRIALENDRRMRHLVENVTDYAIISMDLEGNIENWNKGAERLKGYKSDEIIGKNFTTFFTKKDQEAGKPLQLLQRAIKEGHAIDEGLRVKKNGEKFWVNVTIAPIYDGEGQMQGFSKITRDLTEVKKAAEIQQNYTTELELKNTELEQFVYIASHDLQEPLRTVTSFSELLHREYGETFDETGKKSMRFILEATERMRKLILALLHYGLIGKGNELQTVDCGKILDNLKVDLDTTIENQEAEITVGKLPNKLKAYPTEMRQLFQNLISNAIKFSPSDRTPTIHISAAQKNGQWQFAVKDNGIGIEENHKERIFKIFQRLNNRKNYEGTGIGLAHCKKIVDLHKGKIWVESTVGEGSTFYFTIPK